MNLSLMKRGSVVLVAGLLSAACGDDVGSQGQNDVIAQCQATGYIAFDSANHQNQDIRVGVFSQMNDLMSDAKSDFTLAADRFARAKNLYTDLASSAKFRDKVQGRNDDHLDGSPLQGDRLDATIIQWLDFGVAATSNVEASVAKQWVDKTLQEFFFLSVHQELVAGSRKNWDEAFGYYGAKADNDEANLEGLANTAFKRDSNNGTNLRAEVFNDLIDGSCEVEKALQEAGAEQIDVTAFIPVDAIIARIDLNLQEVLAYSAGHEAFGMQDIIAGGFDSSDAQDTDKMWVKMAELAPFFTPLGRIMAAKGGVSAERATEIRALIDLADFSDFSDIAWMTTFATQQGGTRIIELLEAEYGIDIKG